jgi:hypothetical protein
MSLPIEVNISVAKCEHPALRTFTFKDGKTITMCPGLREVRSTKADENNKLLWLEPCTEGDEHRRKVLAPRMKR